MRCPTLSIALLLASACSFAPTTSISVTGTVDGLEPTFAEAIWYGIYVEGPDGHDLANYGLVFTSETDACARFVDFEQVRLDTAGADDADATLAQAAAELFSDEHWSLWIDTWVELEAVGDVTLAHSEQLGTPMSFAASMTHLPAAGTGTTWPSVGGQVDMDVPLNDEDLLNGAAMVTLGGPRGSRDDVVVSYRAVPCLELGDVLWLQGQ
jgi:hypothetical protein